jgi:hypothetical protein
MPTQLLKLDPRYTVALTGFDNFGAAAAITNATADGFTVTGVFRDAADFAVLMLYDADDFWGHPRIKYLPDFSLANLVLEFDVTYAGLQQLDSSRFPTIDWPYLDVVLEDGSTAQFALFEYASQSGGSYIAASNSFTVAASPAIVFDRVTVWYENEAFDFLAAGGETAAQVAANLVTQINTSPDIIASANGAVVTVTARRPGSDGNMITLYAQSKTGTLSILPAVIPLVGGVSTATWHVKLDFSALKIDQVRQMWMTLAPAIANGAAYAGNEWSATFANWKVTDPKGNQPLKVAGPGSVRVEETDRWCTFLGSSWAASPGEAGFYSKGFAQRATAIGDSVTIEYWCQSTHDLYLGTTLYSDRGMFGCTCDGDPVSFLDCYLSASSQLVARRRLRTSLAPGKHTVTLTVAAKNSASSGNAVYFDFLEAAVLADVPDPIGSYTNRSPAVDYDTDHGYRLPPARLLWMFDQLGYAGEMDLYVGVFWWMQKVRQGGTVPSLTLDFAQTSYVTNDGVFLSIGGELFGKTVFPIDTAASIAAHFAYFINEVSAGVWASVTGTVLTITARAAGSAYDFTFQAAKNPSSTGGGILTGGTVLTFTGSLTGGVVSTWIIDPTQANPINVATSAWLADFFAQCKARGRGVVPSLSMELCFPPAAWAALFPDGKAVETATGFGTINSTQCAPGNAEFLEYQVTVYLECAKLMKAAGVPVVLQFGEFLWWYFGNAAGMAYYDPATVSAARSSLGRALHQFLTPNDDPSVNSYADATFLRNRLRDHVAAIASAVKAVYPAALVEVLYPYDVNYPRPAGVDLVGGRLNYYVNTPPEWQTPGALDRIRIEALDRGASSRNLTLAIQAMKLAIGWGWPPGLVRYLYPVFNGGCPWEREQLAAEGLGLAGLTPFAFDHVSLFGWELEDPTIAPAAQLLGN